MYETDNNSAQENDDKKDYNNQTKQVIRLPGVKPNLSELRVAFQKELSKLNNNNTKSQAFKQIKEIIQNNSTKEALRIYINSLTSYYQSCNLQGKELIAITYGYLANIYHDGLLDPLDNPPSISKTLNRLLSHIRTICLKDNSYIIHKACAHSIIDMLDLCMPKNQMEKILLLFIEPFITLISTSVHFHIREGATVYLNDLIYHLTKQKDTFSLTLLSNITPHLISLICKSTSDLKFLYECLVNLLQSLPFDYFSNKLKEICLAMISLLKHENYCYQTQINCLNILSIVGKRVYIYQIPIEGKEEMLEMIRNYLKDRNHKVQLAAQEAIKSWNSIQKENFLEDLSNDQKIQCKRIKSSKLMVKKVHEGKVEELEQFDSELPRQVKEDVYNKGMGDVLKLSSFIKNHSKLNRSPIHSTVTTDMKVKKRLKHPCVKKYDDYTRMHFDYNIPLSYNDEGYNKQSWNIDTTIQGTECVPNAYEKNNTQVSKNPNFVVKYQYNNKSSLDPIVSSSSMSTILSLIDMREFNQSMQDIKMSYSAFERKFNTKMYLIEEKVNTINTQIKENEISIIKNHNNILDDTICDLNDKTEINIDIDNWNNETLVDDDIDNIYNNDYQLISIWKRALLEISEAQFENGFSRINALGDDIYLLRLMLIKGTNILKVLSPNLSKQLVLRINKINRAHQLEYFLFSLIDQMMNDPRIFNLLYKEEINEILHTLNEYSNYNNSLISKQAAQSYNSLLSIINS